MCFRHIKSKLSGLKWWVLHITSLPAVKIPLSVSAGVDIFFLGFWGKFDKFVLKSVNLGQVDVFSIFGQFKSLVGEDIQWILLSTRWSVMFSPAVRNENFNLKFPGPGAATTSSRPSSFPETELHVTTGTDVTFFLHSYVKYFAIMRLPSFNQSLLWEW